ncbi:MAG: hypothetical protein NTX00_00560 [Candidatus Parcubacteria bacterium]|nr:hypothetical protein [Candidatus Parcubacteria bacterium]
MEEKDVKQIKEIVDQGFQKGFQQEFPNAFKQAFQLEFGQIWDKNIAPAFDDVYQRFDGIENRFEGVETRLNRIESQMVTKSYLDDKLADLEGGVISKLRKEDEKVNRIISLLKKHKVVPQADLDDLDNLQIFPKIQI